MLRRTPRSTRTYTRFPYTTLYRSPQSEQVKHPGEKARLGDAEQEAQDIEARRGPREAEREGDKPPRPDDPREPDSRSHAIEDQIARNLEDAIAEKEQRRPQSIGGIAEPPIPEHLQLRIGAILPADIGDQIAEAEQGPPPQEHPHDRPAAVPVHT